MTTSVLGDQVTHNARRFPDKVAVIDDQVRLTYAELEARANQLAHMLLDRGIGGGGRVALLSASSVAWVVAYVGIGKAGAAVVPVNYRLTPAEIVSTLDDADVSLLIVSASQAAALGTDGTLPPILLLEDGGPGLDFPGWPGTPPAVEVGPDDTQAILYTGGTTGRSKGVVLSHAKVFWNTLNEVIDTHMTERDNTLLATPLHHAAALNCWLLPHLYLGATSTIMGSYDCERMLRLIEAERVTNAFMPPSMAREAYLHPAAATLDLGSFRRWYVGGAMLSAKDRDAMHALIPGVRIYVQYGLTEAGVIVTVLKEEDYASAPHSIGRAFLNTEIKILRDDLTDAGIGEVGEIAVRGPAVMDGYFRRPDATSAVFHDGWLRSGDAGSIDAGGFLTFNDRLKDMVKTGGLNVYSQEVEQILLRHAEVREAAIVGLPSDKWGEEVVAVVVLRDGAQLSQEALIAHCRAQMAGYKTPKRVLFIPYSDLPVNYSGKIMKRELRTHVLTLLATT